MEMEEPLENQKEEEHSKSLHALAQFPNIQEELSNSVDPIRTSRSLMLQLVYQLERFGSNEESHDFYHWLKNITSDGNSPVKQYLKDISSKSNKHTQIIEAIRRDIIKEIGIKEKPLNDGFLFETHADFLQKNEFKSKYVCNKCGSTDTKYLNLISHSASLESLIQLFTFRLPNLEGMKILDIGSGLGSILYGGFYFSKAKEITGVELNSEFCQIVKKIVSKYGMTERVIVIEGDLMDQSELLNVQDVVLFNNAFEYFIQKNVQFNLWKLIQNHMKKGAYLVTNPCLEDILRPLELIEMIKEWVQQMALCNVDSEIFSGFNQPDEMFSVYIVK